MRFIIVLLILLPAAYALEISQVYYDPIGSEAGGEAVEIYNNNQSPIDISGLIIRTESSQADAIIPQGTILAPLSYFLIADAGFETLKDDPSWPEADYEEAITLTNTNAGVALVLNTHIIDSVGWGDSAQIDAGLFSGSPHLGAQPGESLTRLSSTGNNLVDFVAQPPSFHNSQQAPQGEIILKVIVTQTFTKIASIVFNEDDDPQTNGVQVLPYPLQKRQIPLSIITSNPLGVNETKRVFVNFSGTLSNLSQSIIYNETTSQYDGIFEIDFYETPKNYTIQIITESTFGTFSKTNASFQYLSMAGVQIDSTNLLCEGLAGQRCEIPGDVDMLTKNNATVRNIGNVPIDIDIQGSSLNSSTGSFPISNVNITVGDESLVLGENGNIFPVNIFNGPYATRPLSVVIDIPSQSNSGEYTGTLNILALPR